MKHVGVGTAPPSLDAWKLAESVLSQRHYDGSLPTSVKDEIRHARVRDQGYLCPYTLRAIHALVPTAGDPLPRWDAHVEHLIPRSVSLARANEHASKNEEAQQRAALEETVDYRNLLACVNRAANLPYGAATRGARAIPISPFDPGCEMRFQFSADGHVGPNLGDTAATECIRLLSLDHDSLISLRLAALYSRGLTPRRPDGAVRSRIRPKTPSPTAARQLAAQIIQRDASEHFEEFCLPIAQVAIAYASTHS